MCHKQHRPQHVDMHLVGSGVQLNNQAGRDKTSQPAGGPQRTVMVAEALDHAD